MSVYCAIGCRKIGRYPKRVQDGSSQDLLKYQPDTDAQMLAESEGLCPFRFTLGRRFHLPETSMHSGNATPASRAAQNHS